MTLQVHCGQFGDRYLEQLTRIKSNIYIYIPIMVTLNPIYSYIPYVYPGQGTLFRKSGMAFPVSAFLAGDNPESPTRAP